MITKSNYVSFCKCPRSLYLSLYQKDAEEINEESIRKGNETGEKARCIFNDYVLVGKDTLDCNVKVEETKRFIDNKESVICEASFMFRDLFCAVDILRRVDDEYEIYEVKSTTSENNKENMLHYYQDIAFQYFVLTKLGYKIKGAYLVLLNEKYVRKENLDVNKLFKIIRVDENKIFLKEKDKVRGNVAKMRSIVNNGRHVDLKVIPACMGQCSFSSYCMKDLKDNSILNLYSCRKRFSFYDEGIDTFEKLLESNKYKLNEIQYRQIDFLLNNKDETYVDKYNLSKFLNDVKYPVYFLDFESINEAIPPFKNSKVYQQIPVQFSLHVLDESNTLTHYEYLGDGVSDPREDVARLLNEYIKEDGGSIVAYNASFEKNRIKELVECVPSYPRLSSFDDRFIDLLDIFRNGYLYNKLMKNSFSIKSTLPALFPNDKELDYKSLDTVRNGNDAMKAYNKLKHLNDDEKEKLSKNLLEYCKLDTYAMVKLYLRIVELSKEGE